MSLPLRAVLGPPPEDPEPRAIGELVTSATPMNDAHQLFSEKQPEDRVGLPRLYLDVDGVLVEHYGNPAGLQLRAGAGSFVRFAADNFNVVWATAWRAEANLLIPALAGFPLPGYGFPAIVWHGCKPEAILAREGQARGWVWVDDEDRAFDREVLKRADALGNLILVGPSKPLTHVTWKLKRWLAGGPR